MKSKDIASQVCKYENVVTDTLYVYSDLETEGSAAYGGWQCTTVAKEHDNFAYEEKMALVGIMGTWMKPDGVELYGIHYDGLCLDCMKEYLYPALMYSYGIFIPRVHHSYTYKIPQSTRVIKSVMGFVKALLRDKREVILVSTPIRGYSQYDYQYVESSKELFDALAAYRA